MHCISSTSCFWLISQWLSFTSPYFKQRNVQAARISAGFLPAGMSEGWRSWVERQSRKDLFGCLFSANQCQGNGAMHSRTPYTHSVCLREGKTRIKSNPLWEERRDEANGRRTKTWVDRFVVALLGRIIKSSLFFIELRKSTSLPSSFKCNLSFYQVEVSVLAFIIDTYVLQLSRAGNHSFPLFELTNI